MTKQQREDSNTLLLQMEAIKQEYLTYVKSGSTSLTENQVKEMGYELDELAYEYTKTYMSLIGMNQSIAEREILKAKGKAYRSTFLELTKVKEQGGLGLSPSLARDMASKIWDSDPDYVKWTYELSRAKSEYWNKKELLELIKSQAKKMRV